MPEHLVEECQNDFLYVTEVIMSLTYYSLISLRPRVRLAYTM